MFDVKCLSAWRPRGITSGEPDDAVEQGRARRQVDHRAEEPLTRLLLIAELRHEPVHDFEQTGLAPVRLAAAAGQVPAVDDEPVQGYNACDLTGYVHPTSARYPTPRSRVAPRCGQDIEVTRDPRPPVVTKSGRIARRGLIAESAGVLARRCSEGKGQSANVVQQVADGVRRTGRRPVEQLVGYGRNQLGHPSGRGL